MNQNYLKDEEVKRIINSLQNNLRNNIENKLVLLDQLKTICYHKANIEIIPLGKTICMLCQRKIFENDRILQTECECMNCLHISCLKKLNFDQLQKLSCSICSYPIKEIDLKRSMGQDYDNLIEKLNLDFIKKLTENELLEKRNFTKNYKFNCVICLEEKNVENDCITLDCCHRFCKDCIHSDLLLKIKDKMCNNADLKCFDPKCNKFLGECVIQYVLTSKEYDSFNKIRLSQLNPKSILKENEVFFKCPRGECSYIFILLKDSNLARHRCELCNLLFCLKGCVNPHEGQTCDEYKKYLEWKGENDLAEQKFNLLVEKDNLKLCAGCGAWVLKNNGCNHMTCRCKYQFCYVCGLKWRSCKH